MQRKSREFYYILRVHLSLKCHFVRAFENCKIYYCNLLHYMYKDLLNLKFLFELKMPNCH